MYRAFKIKETRWAAEATPDPAEGAHSAPHQTALLVVRGLAAPPREPYSHFRPFGRQAAALRALLNQCPGMNKSKSGHPTVVSTQSASGVRCRTCVGNSH